MNDFDMNTYVGKYKRMYKLAKRPYSCAPVPLQLQAVEIHIPKKFNTLFEMMHDALEYLGVLASDNTWNFEFDGDSGTSVSVYDEKGKDVLSFVVNLNQPTILLCRNRYGTGAVINCHDLPRYDNYNVVFNILELTPTEEVEVKPEVKEPPVKQYNVVLKSGSTLIMNLTDEMYKSFTGVGIIADAKQLIVVDASEIESIREVKPVTDYTKHTPVKSDLSFDGLNLDYVGEGEWVPKKNHSEYYSNDDGVEAIDIIERCHLHFDLGNVLKYLMRAGKKTPSMTSDYQKTSWYIKHLLNSRSLLREQFEALEPYFDKSGAIIKLVGDDVLNEALCEILTIDSLYDSFPKFETALNNLYYVLHLIITKEVRKEI